MIQRSVPHTDEAGEAQRNLVNSGFIPGPDPIKNIMKKIYNKKSVESLLTLNGTIGGKMET